MSFDDARTKSFLKGCLSALKHCRRRHFLPSLILLQQLTATVRTLIWSAEQKVLRSQHSHTAVVGKHVTSIICS